MKNLISFIAAVFFSVTASWAQIFMIDSFSLSSADGGYGIYVDINCEAGTELYFDMDTDDPSQKTRMQLSKGECGVLKKNLNSAMDVFESWRSTAAEKSMALLTKDMPLNMDTQEIIFTMDGQWNIAESVDLNVTFYVNNDGHCFAILETGALKSKEVVAKGFSLATAVSPNGRWNTAWSRSEESIIRYGNSAYLIFANREEVNMFINRLDAAIRWKDNNREIGKTLVRPSKKK